MREILFRGKRLDNGKCVYGSLIDGIYGAMPVIVTLPSVDDDFKLDFEYDHVDPATVGQYTGLKDKNGKRIWEGDILHIAKIADGIGGYYQPPLDYPVNVVVKWDLCAWMWETLSDDKRYITFPDAWCHYECEVIGNVNDNPELLEK